MDTAKYIGLFLLKNHFCYIHGLGNLELRKKPATYDGAALQPPQYEVVLTPTGSIDDSLANFIATHEQTSISKASNSLRDFSIMARADLGAGKEVELPSVGKFVEENGVIRFITNPHLQYTPPSIPTLRTARQVEEIPSFKRGDNEEEQTSSHGGARLNWGKIILWVAIILVTIGIIVLGIYYISQRQPVSQKAVIPVKDTLALTPPVAMPPVDTIGAHKGDTTAHAPAETAPAQNGAMDFRVVLNSYKIKATADKRAKTLITGGNKAEVIMKDSGTYLVVMPVSSPPADTAHMLDSLRRFFNPKGVHIYR